jgi:D-glycero-D-manno-heptose 1,7-bisphosphate phosphatase
MRFSTYFLDRDGTINGKAPEGAYVVAPEAVELLPGAADAIRRLNEAGRLVVVITNQRGVARGHMTEGDVARVNARLGELLAARGAHVDAFYVCPHESDSCDCRKPRPGLLLQAAADHGIDLANAVMVGDAASDVAAGRAAGVSTVRLAARPDPDADLTVTDLAAAVERTLTGP